MRMITRYFTYLKKHFTNLKLRNKFLIGYAILLILPLLITGILFYNWFAKVTIKQTKEISIQSVKQAELNISYIKEQVENLGDMVFWDMEFRELLKQKDTLLYDQVEEYEKIINMITNMEESPKIHRIRLYVLDNKLYARNNQTIFPLSMLEDNKYFQSMVKSQNKSGWTSRYSNIDPDGRKKDIVSYMIILNDFDNFGRVIGCLFIDVLENDFYSILKETEIGNESLAFVHNKNGDIISSTDSHNMNKILSIYSQHQPTASFTQFHFDRVEFSAIRMPIRGTEWEIVYMIPTRESMKNVVTSIKFTVIIIFSCILLAAAIAIVVSDKITQGINQFIDNMESVNEIGSDIADDSGREYSRDEIGQLQHHYDRMMNRIRNLVTENYEVQLQRREAQLRALQAQINPHFLYNVLDYINWMAIRAKAYNISDMVTDLGRFYRIGLSGGRDVIQIREELEHVRTYLKIQKARFEETIEVVFHVSEDILDYPIVKLTLQPIVENAIVHGILTKPTQSGMIQITGAKVENRIRIQIIDDGAGVDFEKVRYILSDPKSQFTSGFGIKNVNERIKLYFGQQYGVDIKRVQDKWTVVDIILPDTKDGNE